MFAAGIITLRETLEAALVAGIILSYLSKTNQNAYKKFVWRGIAVGCIISILFASLVNSFFSTLQTESEHLFEGILMFIAASFLTWMILWVHRQKEISLKIKKKVLTYVEKGSGIGIFIFTAHSVVREGSEAVLYLKAISLAGRNDQFLGAVFGVLIALFVGFLVFSFAMKVSLSTIFKITTVFLLFFAAGLVSNGVHEFQVARLLPVFSFDPLVNISHIASEESWFGSILKTLFGYTSKPTILEISSYSAYILFVFWLKQLTDRILKNRK